ncbi:L-asparaginase [Hanseniaspora valbyensis NRRL Y-1626]|uniref:asparaginase n=1 Tax=Hanseniaspora valbyensis NRRL Y-1626 TaxID=766949 RepID=A0A1B7TEA9_9ASCO|nr:L-asparaginase [Hanseniaspora valbyensis NRRL Y-1626]
MVAMEVHTICDDVENCQFIVKPEDVNLSSTLPKIKVIGCGGTIASVGANSSTTAGYKIGLTIQELLAQLPDLSEVCQIDYEQVCNLDSKEMNEEYLMKVYACISRNLQKYDGFVITHGTDTITESSFFLELTLDFSCPIVLTGSMKPASALSSDSMMNLYSSFIVASSPASKNRGTLIVMNDQITSGFYANKTNANSIDSFNVRQGYLGNFVNNELHYYYPNNKPIGIPNFRLNVDITSLDKKDNVYENILPNVVILYAHQGFNCDLVKLVEPHYSGIVIATMGAGSLPDSVNDYLKTLNKPIIYSKHMDGMVPKVNIPVSDNCISAGYLTPEKARILLQLGIYSKKSHSEIRKTFHGVYGG